MTPSTAIPRLLIPLWVVCLVVAIVDGIWPLIVTGAAGICVGLLTWRAKN